MSSDATAGRGLDLLAELIDDARLVAAYGQRTGRLTDFELVSAVGAIDKLERPSWGDPAVLGLQAALNRALQDIHPVLVSDLRDPLWDPFKPSEHWYERWPQMLFAVFALLLLALTSWSTLNYDRGTSLIAEINELIRTSPRGTVQAGVRKLLTADIYSEDYYTAVGSLKDLQDRIGFYRARSYTFEAEVVDAGQQKSPMVIEAVISTAKAALPAYVETEAVTENYGRYDPCADARELLYLNEKFPGTYQATMNIGFRQTMALCREHIDPTLTAGAEYNVLSYRVREWLDLWGRVLLPALYGAFGATVFYMRRALDPTIRDPSLAIVASRVAMGAFAGVIVTWFWAPNNQLLNGFTSAGLTLFTVSFLIGFGVDVLFVLLDRLVTGAMAIAKGSDGRASVIAPVYLTTSPPAGGTPTDAAAKGPAGGRKV